MPLSWSLGKYRDWEGGVSLSMHLTMALTSIYPIVCTVQPSNGEEGGHHSLVVLCGGQHTMAHNPIYPIVCSIQADSFTYIHVTRTKTFSRVW